jgi:hypothetical protein
MQDQVPVRITFPPGSKASSKGRNGHIQTVGIELVSDTVTGLVTLSPVTSRNKVSPNALLQIPLDAPTLRALAACLTELADGIFPP